MRSVVVVLPASTWAMMPMFRSLSSMVISVVVSDPVNAAPQKRKATAAGQGHTPRQCGVVPPAGEFALIGHGVRWGRGFYRPAERIGVSPEARRPCPSLRNGLDLFH